MCNYACIDFGTANLPEQDVRRSKVLEVGALDVNGSLRPIVERLGPAAYLGVDLEMGPGVDEICDANDLIERFGKESFDLVINTEMLEHVRDWRKIVSNLKNLLTPGGVLLVTTRSSGFPYHGYPFDFWRYELDDMRAIFSDMSIESLQEDPKAPGVFMKARKPSPFVENDLRNHRLYSMIKWKRCRQINAIDILSFNATTQIRSSIARLRSQLATID